jgi:hypothetical protein
MQRSGIVLLNRQRLFELRFRILKQSHSPKRVGVVRERLGIGGRASCEELAIGIRMREIAQTQRRLHAACQRLTLDAAVIVPLDLLEGGERFTVTAVRKQQLRELQLNVRGFRRNRRCDGRKHENSCHRRGKGNEPED